MNRFIVLAVAIASVSADAPLSGGYSSGAVSAGRNFAFGSSSQSSGSGLNEYVDQALLDRVAAVIETDGDGTARAQDNEGSQYVDAALISRISASLDGFGSSSTGSGPGYTEYGVPALISRQSLGEPEPAKRIAEWDLSETAQSPSFNGGYQNPVQPGNEYGVPAPVPTFTRGSQNQQRASFSLGQPEVAQKITEFELNGQQAQANAGFSRGGYN